VYRRDSQRAVTYTIVAEETKYPLIMGDDIGWFNPSCYNSGVMGYDSDIHGVEAKHVPSVNNIFQIVERSGQARLFCRQ
jgi:hypothetical protein